MLDDPCGLHYDFAMTPQEAAATVEEIKRWVDQTFPALLTSGENWKITLHGGRSGDVRHVVERFGSLVEPSKGRRPEPER